MLPLERVFSSSTLWASVSKQVYFSLKSFWSEATRKLEVEVLLQIYLIEPIKLMHPKYPKKINSQCHLWQLCAFSCLSYLRTFYSQDKSSNYFIYCHETDIWVWRQLENLLASRWKQLHLSSEALWSKAMRTPKENFLGNRRREMYCRFTSLCRQENIDAPNRLENFDLQRHLW